MDHTSYPFTAMKGSLAMLKNYFIIAIRNLRRNLGYSIINIVGLSLGIACCTLIFLFIRNEFTYDRFHDNADQIYRVYREEHRTNGTIKLSSGSPTPLAPTLQEEIPGIVNTARMMPALIPVQRGDLSFSEDALFSDASFLEMFSFPLLAGNPTEALASPGSVVISEEVATKYFNDDDPIGKVLSLRFGDTFEDHTITGIVGAFPTNSSITFDLLLPFSHQPGFEEIANEWQNNNCSVYIQLADGMDLASVAPQIPRFVEQYYGDQIRAVQEAGWWIQGDDAFSLHLQPFVDVHLQPEIMSMAATTNSPLYSYILLGIGVLVLLIACVNFMTMATGLAASRAREVGVRKVLGAARFQLMKQFWGEAILMSLFALFVGLVLAELFLPVFNALSGQNLSLDLATSLSTLPALLLLTVATGLIAGCYPALILSRFHPSTVLKGTWKLGKGEAFTRFMVVVQFTISIGMIAMTAAMFNQVNFLKTKSLGFTGEAVVALPLQGSQEGRAQVLQRLKDQVGNHQDILNIAGTDYGFNEQWSRTVVQNEDVQLITYTTRIDEHYLETIGLTLLEGRALDPSLETDASTSVLINETFAREIGWESPIGQPIPLPGREHPMEVVGVVKDFHFRSLHSPIEPAILHMWPSDQFNYALVNMREGRIAETLSFLESTWQKVAPDQSFSFFFLDQEMDRRYRDEERWTSIVQYASFFTILIACLGLFGLAALASVRRTKEMGVRKVLGASSSSLMVLLSKDFVFLVSVAFVLASPLAYYAITAWLDNFAYRVDLGVGPFLFAGIAALAIALLTVSYQSAKAALTDPVDSLRYE